MMFSWKLREKSCVIRSDDMFRIYGLYIKKMLRTKSALFWNLAFPIILGTLFYFAFSNIYGDQASKAMRIAIVGENAEQHPFTRVLEGLTYDDGSRMMDITFATEEEANRMLDNAGSSEGVAKALFGSSLEKDKEKGDDDRTKRVIGVITLSGAQDVTLTIKENDMYQSILSGIVSAYRQKAAFLADSMEKGGEAYEEAVKVVSEDVEFVISKGMAGENKDPYLAYFYNLIAMMCMLGSILAMDMFISVQPNATNTGLRIGASGVSRLKYEAAIFLAVFTMQMVCTGIALVYILGILKLRFGGELGGILLTVVLGNLLGIALGYLVSHIGHFSYNKKNTILTLITLGGGAISGLYAVMMKAVIEAKAPIINRINPMSVITDAFYSLNMFGTGDRYFRSIITMICLSAALLVIGALLGRRNQYESL